MKTDISSFAAAIKWKAQIFWERQRGLDFATIVEPEVVGLDSRKSFRSSASGGRHLRQALQAIHPTAEDRIIDIGCGKGSAMRTMLEFPFLEVWGVELSPTLANIATDNFAKLQMPKAHIFCGDAAEFRDYDRFDIFYLYNPFPESVMASIVDKLAAVAATKPIQILYNNPTCHSLFQSKFDTRHDFPAAHGQIMRLYSNRSANPADLD